MTRIVHTGDMHLDSPFVALPPRVAEIRKTEQRQTFLRIIEDTRKMGADILCIAGDVFDSRFVSPSTIEFLVEAFREIHDTPVLIAPGNHDFLAPDSPYKSVNFGENVHVFGDTLSMLQLGETTVYGKGFSSRFAQSSFLPGERLQTEKGSSILLMHGDVGTESDYNPLPEKALAETGVSYAALGHVHSFSGFQRAGTVCYAYSGIPEARHFDEPVRGGYICGEVGADGVDLSFVEIGKRRNITLSVDVAPYASSEGLLDAIRAQLSKENLYKIVLFGQAKRGLYPDAVKLAEALMADCLYCKVEDATAAALPAEESLLEKLFVERLSGRTDEIAQKAIKAGLGALRRSKK